MIRPRGAQRVTTINLVTVSYGNWFRQVVAPAGPGEIRVRRNQGPIESKVTKVTARRRSQDPTEHGNKGAGCAVSGLKRCMRNLVAFR